jgi:hypothetical protein
MLIERATIVHSARRVAFKGWAHQSSAIDRGKTTNDYLQLPTAKAILKLSITFWRYKKYF